MQRLLCITYRGRDVLANTAGGRAVHYCVAVVIQGHGRALDCEVKQGTRADMVEDGVERT